MKIASTILESGQVPHKQDKERYQIAHKVSGRVRFYFPALYKENERCSYIRHALSKHPSVKTLKVQPLTGSLTVSFIEPIDYDEKVLSKILKILDEVEDYAPEELEWRAISEVSSSKSSQQHWWQMPDGDLLAQLQTSRETGLRQFEVEKRLLQYGENKMEEQHVVSKAEIWHRQFANPQVALLAGSAALSLLTGGLFDVVLIGGVVVFNSILGYLAESHAESVISSIGHIEPQTCRVLREGRDRFISEFELVPGDIIYLETGIVPADIRLLHVKRLMVDESALTGESLPVEKSAEPLADSSIPIAERRNMLYRGTIITAGQGLGVVVATANQTEIAYVRQLVYQTENQLSPLQKNLATLGHQTVAASSIICGSVFLIGLARGFRVIDILKTSISLAVAAVPEGLPTIGTSTLALAVQRLEKIGILARRLPVVETLGAVDVLCLDKTGTLTMNRMEASEIMLAEEHFKRPFSNSGKSKTDLETLVRTSILCNDSYFKDAEWEGSSTELAFIYLGEECGIKVRQTQKEWRRLKTRYRTENRQFMVTFHKQPHRDDIFCAVKGNPTQLIEKCLWYQHDGKILRINPEVKQEILAQNEELASKALRVLGIAYAYTEAERGLSLNSTELVWLGLVGLRDPTRKGLHELIASIHQAHIRTVMMTGDQTATARAIGQELNLSNDRPLRVVDAKELFQKSSEEIDQLIDGVHIFSRVSPSEKLKIVQALQRRGHVVAMTGDGINDSPALKAADVGIAMGKFGSRAARESADLVLAGDKLQVLFDALELGRSIRSNLRRSIRFLLATNLSEILLMFSSISLGRGSPLNPIQLLWINLLTDVFPALALALESPRANIMTDKPVKPNEDIFSPHEKITLLKQGLVFTGLSMFSYEYAQARYQQETKANTQAFFTLTASQTLYTMTALYERRLSLTDFLHLSRDQRSIQWSMLISLAFIFAGVRSPQVRALLKNDTLDTKDLAVGIVNSVLSFIANEVIKDGRKPAVSMQ